MNLVPIYTLSPFYVGHREMKKAPNIFWKKTCGPCVLKVLTYLVYKIETIYYNSYHAKCLAMQITRMGDCGYLL